jgi:hypothetical protein
MAEKLVYTDRREDPSLNDDSQPSVTSADEALRLADLNAGLTPAEVAVRAPADAMDLHDRMQRADQSPAEGVEELVAKVEGAPGGPMSTAEDFGTGTYEDRTTAQLQALARSKGLATSGSKAELIDRLRA